MNQYKHTHHPVLAQFTTIRILFLLLLVGAYSLENTWAAGRHDEKYFIQLEHSNSQHNRNLERAFFEYGRAKKLDIAVYYLDKLAYSEKQKNLDSALNEKFPIIIFQYYEPDITDKLIEKFYKVGEFTQEGYMGGFVFVDSPIDNASSLNSNINLTLPFSIIGFDTKYIASEILNALDNALKDKQGKILLVQNSLSTQEQSLSKSLLKILQSLNTNSNHTITTLDIGANSEISEKSNGSASNIYSLFYDYSQTEDNILAVIALSDEDAFEAKSAVIDYNTKNATKNAVPQIIGFGASPEATKAIENKEMLLTFSLDYKAYVQRIMQRGKDMFEISNDYVVTDAMLDDKSLIQTFDTVPEVFPVQSVSQ